MPRICSICGKKIMAFAAGWPYKSRQGSEGLVCDGCLKLLDRLKQGRLSSDQEIEEYKKDLEHLKNCLALPDVDRNMVQEHLRYAEDKLAYAGVMARMFPAEESRIVADALIVNDKKRILAFAEPWVYGVSYGFEDLIDYEVREDGDSITQGRAGAAVVGTLLAGSAGAIVGSSMSRRTSKFINKLEVVMTFKDFDRPTATISLISQEVAKASDEYRAAVERCDQIVATLKQIMDAAESGASDLQEQKAVVAVSVADEILKFKGLLDIGAITQEEFDEQKRKLLALGY